MDPFAIGATIVASVLGSSLFTAFVNGFFQKYKTKAEADNLIGEAYGSLIKNLRSEIDVLRNEFQFLKKDHENCMLENKNLKLRVENLEQKK